MEQYKLCIVIYLVLVPSGDLAYPLRIQFFRQIQKHTHSNYRYMHLAIYKLFKTFEYAFRLSSIVMMLFLWPETIQVYRAV